MDGYVERVVALETEDRLESREKGLLGVHGDDLADFVCEDRADVEGLALLDVRDEEEDVLLDVQHGPHADPDLHQVARSVDAVEAAFFVQDVVSACLDVVLEELLVDDCCGEARLPRSKGMMKLMFFPTRS